MGAWRPKHVEDYDTIKCLWKWKCMQLITLLWYILWELPYWSDKMKGTFCTWGLFKDTLAGFILFISTPHFLICCLEQSPRCLTNFVNILRTCNTCYMQRPCQQCWQHSWHNVPRSVHVMTVLVRSRNFSTASCWEILYIGDRFLSSTLLTVATLVV
jgi:hypothetical protein